MVRAWVRLLMGLWLGPRRNMTNYSALDIVMQVAEEQAIVALPDTYVTLDSGVILEITGISSETYNAIIRKFESLEPPIPVVELKSKGGRMEPNPNDPKYINDHNMWKSKQASALSLAVYSFGTRVHFVPAGVLGPESEETVRRLRLAHLLESDTEIGRLVAWLQHFALSRNALAAANEINRILFAAGRAMGVTKEDVAEAAKRP